MRGMRIHSIEAIAIDIPLARNFGGSTYTVLKRSTVITRLHTEGGLVSEVYNGDNREHGREIVRLIHDELAPRVRGLSIFAGESVWERMFALTHVSRDRKTLMEAIACVDCALWDVLGKALGQSVCALLGGYRDRLPIISIGGYYVEGKTLADIGREMEAYRAAGMAGCKFNGAAPPLSAPPPAWRWPTTKNRRSPASSSAPSPTAPTRNASPTPSATRCGRRCGPTARRSRTACSRWAPRPASASAWTTG